MQGGPEAEFADPEAAIELHFALVHHGIFAEEGGPILWPCCDCHSIPVTTSASLPCLVRKPRRGSMYSIVKDSGVKGQHMV